MAVCFAWRTKHLIFSEIGRCIRRGVTDLFCQARRVVICSWGRYNRPRRNFLPDVATDILCPNAYIKSILKGVRRDGAFICAITVGHSEIAN